MKDVFATVPPFQYISSVLALNLCSPKFDIRVSANIKRELRTLMVVGGILAADTPG